MASATVQRLTAHPAANIFPMLDGEEFEALVADIRAHGQRDPIKVDGDGKVIDGRNRLRACRRLGIEPEVQEVDTDDAVALVLSLNLVRRHLTSAQRAFVALEVKRQYEAEARRRMRAGGGGQAGRQKVANPMRSDDAAAKVCRTNRAYMQHAQRLVDQAPDLAAQVRAGAAELKDAVGELRRREQQAAARAGARRFSRANDQVTLMRGDFREVGAAIPDNSVSLIFTDPPYDRASLTLYSDLGAFASRVLRPGGSLITYVGNLGLLDAGNRLSEHLTYWWTCAVGPLRLRQRVVARRLFSGWKALLWFVKDQGPKTPTWVRDMIQSERDKTHHAWGQGEAEARYYIEQLTTPNELVVDPFCGGGTTAAAALSLKRRAWTCDVDARAVSAARARLGL
jgi:ParB-like chromosome segregation protein Spo0J